MTTINQESWNDRDNNETSTKLMTDDAIGSYGMNESRLPGEESEIEDEDEDDDDATLSDDDVDGADLDTDNGDEWDEDDVSETDLDEDDLEDNDEAIADLHNVRNDQFGSLASTIQNGPDPDEVPDESESGNQVENPDDDILEQGSDDEMDYKEANEVYTPEETESPEPKQATLGDIDETFTDQSHDRTSGRLTDHEPGAGLTPPEHGSYNL